MSPFAHDPVEMRRAWVEERRPGCAMSRVEVCRNGKNPESNCLPAEKCRLGETVYRNRWTNAGHHHRKEGNADG